MTTNTFNLTCLQGDLAQAFKWMGIATKEAREGDFSSATYSMMTALQYWAKCQHISDRYIDNDLSESIDWKFFSNKAMAMARQKLEEEGE